MSKKKVKVLTPEQQEEIRTKDFFDCILPSTVKFHGVSPDFPWESNPTFAVYRHASNRKWFALVMDIPKERLGIKDDGMIDIVNLKCDPVLIGSLRNENGIFPAYHMSKDKWISVALDGSVDDEQIKMLLELYAVRLQGIVYTKAMRVSASNDPIRFRKLRRQLQRNHIHSVPCIRHTHCCDRL